MNRVNQVLTAMNEKREYRIEDLDAVVHIGNDEVARVLKLLVGGGLVDVTFDDKYRKNRKYKSRQRALKL